MGTVAGNKVKAKLRVEDGDRASFSVPHAGSSETGHLQISTLLPCAFYYPST